MSATISEHAEAGTLSDSETRLAAESSRRLARYLSGTKSPLHLRLQPEDATQVGMEIPSAAVQVLADALVEMAKGNAVVVLPLNALLTLPQAADVLNGSPDFVQRLVDDGALPVADNSAERRVILEDLLNFKKLDDARRELIADQLTADGQELGMGY